MRLVFIINEFAGNGRGRRVWQRLRDNLTVSYDMHVTGYPEHAYRLACELAEKAAKEKCCILLVVIGGDGTIHEVINGCAGSEYILLGNVPAGSGMILPADSEHFIMHQKLKPVCKIPGCNM